MERTRHTGLKGASTIVYREVRERARLIAEAIRGLEPVVEHDDDGAAEHPATEAFAPAYELAPHRVTGT